MWIFSCGDPEKRIWLRPGERYVFGRVRPSNTDPVNIEIPAERMLSRTHLIVNVSPVGEGDGINIKRRSKVTLQDPGSKHGTRVDGVEIRGKEFPLADNKNSFTIVLGKMTKPYRLQWVPIILSFNIPSKERNNKFFLAPFRNKLEQFDIKTIPVWVPGSTHVVATKRNTPIGLQGLICGAHIVTSDYVDAIVAQTKRLPIPENSLEIPRCPLEIDFDDFFPDPMEYLPPPANEPTNLPAEMYRPDPKRRRMFEGWTFMFFGERQCRALLGPIVDGHGKTEVYDMTWGKTTPQEFVSHVRQRGRDVALIRPISIPEELKDWTEEFIAEVESM
ncbi:hypothetical protein EX30DRAFT_312472 [Ascodesmis nigricans]|uniref:FHA domain-containing protein n=1 Tax=Ascodesmis nigricans TaxID=341454 RepID=A0A4S2MI24_9PEZI|nr:hypothetical protein EX30DRAFT_312472 [Ascodesmis nigricans]